MYIRRLTVLLLALALGLSACRPAGGNEPGPVGVPPSTDLPAPLDTPGAPPPRELTICLGEEPDTLYLYGGPNAAARSVLSVIYDGPIDSVNYEPRAVILQKLPSLADGDAVLTPVAVRPGSEVVNAEGQPVTLDAGVRVRPSGCREDACAVVYDGDSALEMDQLVVTFRLLPGLKWADGAPLTAADSVYSYNVEADGATRTSRYLIDRTAVYEAADELTVQWWGRPGFTDPTYATNFWSPLPAHVLAVTPVINLADAGPAARLPMGWGPFALEEWIPGQELRLSRNPNYFRAQEGLPRFDRLTFRFVSDPQTALNELLAGACDVLDPSVRLEGQLGQLLQLQQSGQAQALILPSATAERLDFGLQPAAYDDGYVPGAAGEPPDLLGDRRTRQALAQCIDRQRMVDSLLSGQAVIPATYLPAGHPLADPALSALPYDPAAGRALLEQAGWRDLDGDPVTPLEAWDVAGVTRGTSLALELITTGATLRRQIGEQMRETLAGCGVGLTLTYLPQEQFYAPGPEGRLFGRNFQLAELAMASLGGEPPCEWYTAGQIPAAGNFWIGTNLSGFSNPAFEAACARARSTLADEPAYRAAHLEAQAILAAELPSLPLYQRPKIAAARPGLCGLAFDPLGWRELRTVEFWGEGGECQP